MELSSVFNVILFSSAMGTIVALLILAVKKLFKNVFDARWHYYIWFLLLLRLLIPYGPESSFSIFNLFAPAYQRFEAGQYVEPAILQEPQQHTVGSISYSQQKTLPDSVEKKLPTPNKKFSFGYKEAGMIWLFGAVFSGLYFFSLNIRLFLRVNGQKACEEAETIKILEDCKAELKINSLIPIIFDTNAKSPFLFGFFRPKLVVSPDILKHLSLKEKRYVFLHELAHLKRKDILIIWITTVLQALHWFNPVFWYSFYRMRVDCEVACDAYVLSRLQPTEYKSYGETIISLLNILPRFRWLPGTTGIANNKSDLKTRIKMISMFKKSSYKWSIIAVCLILLTGCISLTNSKSGVQDNDYVSLLSLNEVIKAFEEEGLKLSRSDEPSPLELKTDTKAQSFTINDNEGTLFIYVFNSMEEGREFPKNEFAHIYRAKNVGIVYLPDEHRIHNIGAVVFEKLNDLETITFEDEGTYWKARFVSKQYEHMWKDDTGLLEYERYSLQIPAIAYKGDIHEIESIEYAYKHSGGAGSGTSSLKEKEDGYIHLGSGGGTGVMRADEVITFTIKWNGKEETLALSAKLDGR